MCIYDANWVYRDRRSGNYGLQYVQYCTDVE